MERGETLDTSVTLADSTPAQRAAVQRLLGRRPRPGTTLTVPLTTVDEVLRRSGASPEGLAAAIVMLTGPITDRANHLASREAAWQRAFAPIITLLDTRPELVDWYERLQATGLVRRLASTPTAAEPLLADLASVLHNLPAAGEPLGRFAARTVRSAHALDDGQPLTTLALSAARALANLPDAPRREAWAAVGVLLDELSSTALTLGLPGDPKTTTGRALTALHSTGQPVVLTLRQLVRDPPRLTSQLVSVCENPVVVSTAADLLGPACRPLICTNGQPGAAVMLLLRQLASAGATLRYHGDFDWGGLRIANVLFDRLPIHPWHFDTPSYRTAARRHPGHDLTGTPTEALWDPDLATAMTELRVKVEEEHLLDDLVDDLRS
jgi:uncharacterized protein (TIGR02679 family)